VCVTPFYDNAPQQASKVYTAQALQAAAAVAGQVARQEEVVLPLGNRSTLFFFSGSTRDDVTWYRWADCSCSCRSLVHPIIMVAPHPT
jgi:hypothetical protein